MAILFISDGRLYIQNGNSTEEITSQFALEKFEEAGHSRAVHGWKSSDMNPYFGSSMIWGGQASNMSFVPFRFKSVIKKNSSEIYYLMTNQRVTGLFKYDLADKQENRIFHRNDFPVTSISYSSVRDHFVVSVLTQEGCIDLELFSENGGHRTITAGDSKDTNPSFCNTNPDEILFQSCGIGRDENGFAYCWGPQSINKVNVESAAITEIIGDDKFDYLLPKEDSAGNIYCIKRPFQGYGKSPVWKLWYILSFPVRFVIAFFMFLDAFTKLFNQKPLRKTGRNIPDLSQLQGNKVVNVLDQTIELAKIKRLAQNDSDLSLVPKSWELIKIDKDGQITSIARNCAYFDIDENDVIFFTNGFSVKKLDNRTVHKLFKHKIIETIVVV